MPEQGINEIGAISLESQIRETDPGDYLKISSFQKHARELDRDPSHPWEKEPAGFLWSYDSGCEVMMSEVSLGFDKPKGILIVMKSDGDTESMAGFDMDPSARDFVESELGTVLRRFPVNAKKSFVHELIELYPELSKKNPDEVALKVTEMALNNLPDDPKAIQYNENIYLPKVNYGEPVASEWQKSALQSILTDISKKMPAQDFREALNKFKHDIPYVDNIYGKNFKYVFF